MLALRAPLWYISESSLRGSQPLGRWVGSCLPTAQGLTRKRCPSRLSPYGPPWCRVKLPAAPVGLPPKKAPWTGLKKPGIQRAGTQAAGSVP